MTPEEKKQYWLKHIQACEQSTLTRKAYCQQHHVSYDQFGYWSKRLHGANKTVRKLIPVTITHVPTTASLHLPNGMRLDAPISALAELLPTLLQLTQAPIK